MEFPELLSVLLYEDCSTHVSQELPRLQALANANGTNTALKMYLEFFNKCQVTPNPEQLNNFCFTVSASNYPTTKPVGINTDLIADDLETAHQYRETGSVGFAMALEKSWANANAHYIKAGHVKAHKLASGELTEADKKILRQLYGEDQTSWNYVEYSNTWWTQYIAKNPFAKHEQEDSDAANEHEHVLATGTDASGDEVENTALTIINATDIKPEIQPWLWPDRIPQGKICWFTGKPGLGKSLATLSVIACVTTGKDWPDGSKNTNPPQDVLVAISEDDLATTVVPRLNAAGADLNRVKFYNRVKLDKGGRHLQLDTDTSLLKRALEANPSIRLLVLDPLESFCGNININANKELRPVTDALKRVCEQTKVTLVGIVHDNKRSDVSAVQKNTGSISFISSIAHCLGLQLRS